MAAGDAQGDAIQFYNDDGTTGSFGELETHGPAVICGEGFNRSTERSMTVVALVSARHVEGWLDDWLDGGVGLHPRLGPAAIGR